MMMMKLFWASDEDFNIALCVAPRHDISLAFKCGVLLDTPDYY